MQIMETFRCEMHAVHCFFSDSKAYNAVVKLEVYNVSIVKEECVNLIHKRMSTALRNLT